MTSPFRHALLRAARALGPLCVLALVWLSWIPRDWEVRTGAAGQVEHLVAYMGTAALLALGFGRAPPWRLGAALVALAAILEIGQIWVPGRTSQVIDFVSSAAGALIGLALGRILLARLAPGTAASRAAPTVRDR
ncbi:hypothetical protein OPKNFCMD_3423 [Methylobacterium crusticola]|uniref:VanZ-like domain-containing protein n=1 Tax=Methylobacterium crusticola TaxID=1697972 RepID=A0ABQ4QZ45_9HYPH|nr:VanZ family protein [Methylobacterium crusticola]GJD50678.1 hypothetical protein OPKNFCMD_3423 [Methylobacterium crusticola]